MPEVHSVVAGGLVVKYQSRQWVKQSETKRGMQSKSLLSNFSQGQVAQKANQVEKTSYIKLTGTTDQVNLFGLAGCHFTFYHYPVQGTTVPEHSGQPVQPLGPYLTATAGHLEHAVRSTGSSLLLPIPVPTAWQ